MAFSQFALRISVLLSIVILFNVSSAIYTEETPVKLLSVAALADRYPTAESKYRVSLERGYVSILHLCIPSL